jgi:hypothetical protein
VEPARESPPENNRGTPVARPSSSTLRPTVRLKTGEILHADVIIGADGLRSIVRRVVSDEDEEPEATSFGLSTYTGSVPMSEIRKCAPLKQLADGGWMAWIGDRRIVLGASSVIHLHNLEAKIAACGVNCPNTALLIISFPWGPRLSHRESEYTPGGRDKLMIPGPFTRDDIRKLLLTYGGKIVVGLHPSRGRMHLTVGIRSPH